MCKFMNLGDISHPNCDSKPAKLAREAMSEETPEARYEPVLLG